MTARAGQDGLTFAPAKEYQSLLLSSDDLLMGGQYTIYLGGSATGTTSDGLYTGGVYTPGLVYRDFTVSSVITRVGGGGPPRP